MDELVPVILGALLGALVWTVSSGVRRAALSVPAGVVSGAAATIVSGEYLESYAYFALDLGEAAVGLTIGFAIARLMRPRTAGTPSSARA